jgi:hypothetical protein
MRIVSLSLILRTSARPEAPTIDLGAIVENPAPFETKWQPKTAVRYRWPQPGVCRYKRLQQ